MNQTRSLAINKIGFVLATALLGVLVGCVGYADRRPVTVYAAPSPGYAGNEVVGQDDYVYYPSYQVYYSGNRHQYVYLEGNSWVTRPEPRRVSPAVLFASPSVRLDFHDSPAIHHASVVQAYPRNWAPPGSSHDNRGNNNHNRQEDHQK